MIKARNIIFVAICILIYSCNKNKTILNLGDDGSKFMIKSNNSKATLHPMGDIVTPYYITLDNVEYGLCLDSNNKINYIFTFDSDFIVKDNIKVGSFFKDLRKNKIEYNNIIGYYTKINIEWYASLSLKEKPNDSTTIKSFFKYKYPKKKQSDSIKLETDSTKSRLQLK